MERSFAGHSSVWCVLYYDFDTPIDILTLGLKAAFDIWELCYVSCINSYSASHDN